MFSISVKLQTPNSKLQTPNSKLQIITLAGLLFLSVVPESHSADGVAQVWAEASNGGGKLGRSGGGLWAILTDSPDTWVYYPTMAGAAVNIVKAAGALNPSINLSGSNRSLPSGYFEMINLSINVSSNSDSSGYVSDLLFLDGTTPDQFAFASINGGQAGLMGTVEQAAIATTALIQNKPVTYTTGDIFYYNTSTGVIQRLNNMLTEVSMAN